MMSRRTFVSSGIMGTAALALPEALRAAPAGRPNMLLILADDLTFTDIGCYGNNQVRTPNMDRLAAEGMRFTRAFTATAMCAPTRQQLYTGIFPVRNGAYPNHSSVKPGTKSIAHYLQALGYRVGLSGKKHFGPAASFPFEEVAPANMAEFISRDKKQPFCLFVCSHNPHPPWKDGDTSPYDAQALILPPYLVDTPQTRAALVKYYAEVAEFDRETGDCMRLVKDAGMEDNTLFVCTSEQGNGLAHGKWTCYDIGLQVAFIARWPGAITAGSTTNAMVQYVDVVPTFVEAAGGTPAKGLDGTSFLPVLLGKASAHDAFVYGVHTTRGIIAGSECYPVRSVRSETHKYIRNLKPEALFENTFTKNSPVWKSWVEKAKTDPKAKQLVDMYQHRPAEELYDIIKDPFELNNIAADPAQNKTLVLLRAKLDQWMKAQGDKGVETEMLAQPNASGKGED